MEQRLTAWPETVETPSGKGADDENFPVGSILIARALRPHVARFYAFARAADDIADNPALSSADKIARLDAFEAGLDGSGPEKARRLGESLAETGVPDRHARDLLAAFRQDATKTRYADWAELIGYCEVSANPVGRYLMDLHGEDRAWWGPSDALCTVLQIINHLQDCADDYREMDRVYIPGDWLAEEGLGVDALTASAAAPGLRRVIDRMLDGCQELLAVARTAPGRPRARRLHAEFVVIRTLAERLAARLARQDPLAEGVKLSKWDFAVAALTGLGALISPEGRA
ncbi:MAG: squalene synthase HpnC [Pseudomonadota bacterium]